MSTPLVSNNPTVSSSMEVNSPASSSSATSINSQSTLSSSQSQPKTGSFFDSIIEFFQSLWTKFIDFFVSKGEASSKALKEFEELINSQEPVTQGAFYNAWERLDPVIQDDFLEFNLMIIHCRGRGDKDIQKWITEEKEIINDYKDSNEEMKLTDYRNAIRCLSVSHAWQAVLPDRPLAPIENRLSLLQAKDRRDLLLFTIYIFGPKIQMNAGEVYPDLYNDGKGYPLKDITTKMIDKIELVMMAAVGKENNKSDEEKAVLAAIAQTVSWIKTKKE